MSVDLWLVRGEPLSWTEVLAAAGSICRPHAGLAPWTFDETSEATNIHFWHVSRVALAMSSLGEGDLQDDDPPELAGPFAVASSSSGAWPWLAWTALTLAEELGARVFDPQRAALLDGPPEHDLGALGALHDAWLREASPTLVTRHWAADVGASTAAGLRALVPSFEASIREALGVDTPIVLSSDEHTNLFHDVVLGDATVSLASLAGAPGDPTATRSLTVEGPAGDPRVQALVDALVFHLGARFRGVDLYR